MQLVAITALGGPLEPALAPLARALDTTAYELRLLMNAGFPAVVLATVDPARATAVVMEIRKLGHRAWSCDRAEVVSSRTMTGLSGFQLGPDAITLRAEARASALPYDDVAALLRGTHRSVTETTETVKGRQLRPVMAIASGGLILSKKTTREVTTRTDQREQVLYLFRRSGAPPWILRERGTDYRGLGAALAPTSLENFQTALGELRKRATLAAFDDRLMSGRPIRGVAEGVEAADILAHLLAVDLLGSLEWGP